MAKININNINDDFLSDINSNTKNESSKSEEKNTFEQYKVLIADDDEEVHRVTKMILRDFTVENHHLKLYHAYSGKDTIEILQKTPDIAVILLDVVMEETHTGLDVVRKIREELKNTMVRIILRTGQPGEAPEEEVIRDYDINDYRLKTELTVKRLNTSMYGALRNYRDIYNLERHKNGLKKIVEASGRLFKNSTYQEFLTSILEELANFQKEDVGMVYVREEEVILSHGFVTMEQSSRNRIVAATGKYEVYVGKEIEEIDELSYLRDVLLDNGQSDKLIHHIEKGFIVENKGKSRVKNYIFIEGLREQFDFELIHLFLSNFAIALDNYVLNGMLDSTQKDIVYALGETVESHFEETGSHVKRISEMMYQFALCNNASYAESEMYKMASTMHDLGKIAIPDSILKKPGRLTDEEFEVIKTHTLHGHRILSKSKIPVLTLAAEIALNHHEKFNGLGYPNKCMGLEIPVSARMMAIVDVFDALSHKRIYKDAMSIDDTINYMKSERGKHFDPRLLDLFFDNIDKILENLDGM